MADRYLLESGAPDGYLLEDGSGVVLMEDGAGAPKTFRSSLLGVGFSILAAAWGWLIEASPRIGS